MMKPLVTVCIPNYNYGHYLRHCLDSVYNQTYENIEVQFSDNASTDDSYDIAQEYRKKFKQRGIYFKVTDNKRNVGSDKNSKIASAGSEGDYIYTLASDFGEMHRLSKIARPDVVVMTNIGQSHLETLGSREGILKAKSEIFDFMNPKGCVFVNGDDDLLCHMREKGGRRVLHFGQNPANEIFASDLESCGLSGTRAVIHGDLKVFPVEVPLPGEHMVLDALAAAAVGMYFGLTPGEIAQGIRRVQNVKGRGDVIEFPFCRVIDGSYNANPGSMKAAIDILTLAFERKAALLGDMLELGEETAALHEEVGIYAVDQKIDVLVCVGTLSRPMYEAARAHAAKNGDRNRTEIFYFEGLEEMIKELPGILRKGDAVLVKASHAMGFEKVVEWLGQAE